MGKAFAPFFGDKTKEELTREIVKIDEKIAALTAEKTELVAALEAHEGTNKG